MTITEIYFILTHSGIHFNFDPSLRSHRDFIKLLDCIPNSLGASDVYTIKKKSFLSFEDCLESNRTLYIRTIKQESPITLDVEDYMEKYYLFGITILKYILDMNRD